MFDYGIIASYTILRVSDPVGPLSVLVWILIPLEAQSGSVSMYALQKKSCCAIRNLSRINPFTGSQN